MFKYKKLKEKVEMLQRIIEHSIPGKIGHWIEHYRTYKGYGSCVDHYTLYLYKDGKEYKFDDFDSSCKQSRFVVNKVVNGRTVYASLVQYEHPVVNFIFDLNNETYIRE